MALNSLKEWLDMAVIDMGTYSTQNSLCFLVNIIYYNMQGSTKSPVQIEQYGPDLAVSASIV